MKRPPSYCLHRPSNRGYVTLPVPGGRPKIVYFPGTFNSAESKQAYDRTIAEYLARGRIVDLKSNDSGPSINELMVPYVEHCRGYYVKNGKQTSQVCLISYAIRTMRELYGFTAASDFNVVKLEAVRNQFIEEKLCRREVNRRTRLCILAFKWLAAKMLIPQPVYASLLTLENLKQGRCKAPDHPEVAPVSEADIERTIPYLSPPVVAMIRLQQLTGMRPGEATQLKMTDLDRTVDPWLYRPSSHKTQHKQRTRTIPLGPKAQELLKDWFRADGLPLFSPKLARPANPLRGGKKENPRRRPTDQYTSSNYAGIVHKACVRAGVNPWSPNQIRHSFATMAEATFGLDAARVLLGHSSVKTTRIYALEDTTKAREIAAKIG